MFDQLTEIICEYVETEREKILPESRFMEDLLDVEIDEAEAANIRTVQEAVEYLEKLEGEKEE